MAKYVKKPVVIEAYQTDKEMIIHTLEGDMKASVGDYIITGVNGEQYPCKPDIFKKTYEPVEANTPEVTPNTRLSFGVALQVLKKGGRCAREGWNGKGQYIYMTEGSNATCRHLKENTRKIIRNSFDEDDSVEIMPHIDMKNAQNQLIIGWAPTQTDMLSNDWYIVY